MKDSKRVIFVFWVAFSLFFNCMPVAAQSRPRVYLEGTWDETGIFILKVILEPQDVGLCGLELDVTYDAELLTLSSCERGNALTGLKFDCSLGDGKIRLLFWGTQNSHEGGRLATICFIAAKESGKCEFSLSLPTKTSAIYFENDRIIATDITLSGLQISLESELPSEQVSSPTETPTEAETVIPDGPIETPTDTLVGTVVPDSPPNPPQSRRSANIAKNICFGFACVTSAVGVLSTIPIFLPDIFRKGYF